MQKENLVVKVPGKVGECIFELLRSHFIDARLRQTSRKNILRTPPLPVMDPLLWLCDNILVFYTRGCRFE